MNPHELSKRLARYATLVGRLARYASQHERDLACGAAALAEAVVERLIARHHHRRTSPLPPAVRGLLQHLWESESLAPLGVLADFSQDHAIPPSPPPPATATAQAQAPSWRRPVPWQVVVFDAQAEAVAADLPAVAGLVADGLTAQERQEIAARLRALADRMVA